MGLLKALFGGGSQPGDDARQQADRQFDILKHDGIRALRTGHADLAARFLDKALQMRDDLEVRDCLSQACIATDRLDDAMTHLAVLAQAQPDNVQIYLRMAQVTYMQEDYATMADVCAKAADADATEASVPFLNARAQLGLGNRDAALQSLGQAVELNPNFVDAYLLRGNTLLQDGDTEGAERDALALMQLAPQYEDVLMLMARVRGRQGRLDEAVELFGNVIDLNPFARDAYVGRARAYGLLGNDEAAKEDLDEAESLVAQATGEQKQVEMTKIDPFGVF